MTKNMFKKLLNILFPLECIGCGKNDTLLCPDCFNSIKINYPDYFSTEHIKQVHISASFHQKLLQNIIHLYKYSYIEKLSEHLSKLIIDYYSQIKNKLDNPIIIPVPLHQKRLLVRCFNQSDLIAHNFCQKFKYQLKNNLIARVKYTKQQAKLNKKGRIENIKGAFEILDKSFIQSKNFIIIDDLYTTGSTVTGIAKLLKDNGASDIWCLVIAKN